MQGNKKIDFYNTEGRFRRNLTKIDSWCKTESNKKSINKLLNWAQARDISYARRVKYLFFLKYVVEWLDKDLDKVDKDDIIYVVGKINGNGFCAETKRNFKSALKKFYDVILYDENKALIDWLYDRRNDIFKAKNEGLRREKTKLTKQDIAKMIGNSNVRMKAYISTLFESCCRPSEILACRISDLQPTKYGFKLNVPQSKTNPRSIPLIESCQYLQQWLSMHPNNKPDGFLFCTDAINNNGELWSPEGAGKQLRIVAKKAGINKRVTNYSFRSSGFTYKSTVKKISTSSMELLMGWSRGSFSQRAKDYDLNTEEDAKNEVMQAYGKEVDDDIVDMEMKKCLRCGEENGFAEQYCKKCASPLDPKIIAQIEMKQVMYEKLWEKLVGCVDFGKLGKDKNRIEKEMVEMMGVFGKR